MLFRISPVELINSTIKIRIIRHLMLHPSPMSEREIASIIHVSHMSVNRALKEFARNNLVSYSAAGKTHLWKLNRKSYAYALVSRLMQSIDVCGSPLENLKENIRNGFPRLLIKKAILYGSVAKGTEESNSDIDLFILVKNNADMNKVRSAAENLSNKCLDLYGNRLETYILSENELKRKEGLGVLREIAKGICIFEGD